MGKHLSTKLFFARVCAFPKDQSSTISGFQVSLPIEEHLYKEKRTVP